MSHRGLSLLIVLGTLANAGCGTTRWSDTSRTATEQLLISDAVDRSISQIDFTPLAGREVYLDSRFLGGMVDEKYIVSTMRQHMMASGCVVRDRVDDAAYVVEVRAGSVGTNRNDMLVGVPATNLPAGGMMPGVPSAIPELPLVKRTAQQGVCKVAVFAYDRMSGHPVWQSGVRQQVSKAKDVWVFGTGPFQRGTIYDGTKFGGERLEVPLVKGGKKKPSNSETVWVTQEMLFQEPPQVASSSTAAPRRPLQLPQVNGSPAVPNSHANTQAAFLQPAAPSTESTSTPPPSAIMTTPAPNPTAGAFGAWQMMDWARNRRDQRTQSTTTPQVSE